jgi:S-formylglutathione hydrolase FrmB
MSRSRRLSIALALIVAGGLAGPSASASRIEAGCLAPTGSPTLAVGVVGCQLLDSTSMGGLTPISYYIPPACDPALGRRCPVLYYLHSTGSSSREGTGPMGSPGNAWVKALTSGPAVDPRTVQDPWNYDDPSGWVPKPPIDMIIVSLLNATVGYGPVLDVDTGWGDWIDRYAAGGDSQRYDTPAPKAAALVLEVVRYVDAHFPAGRDRQSRAIIGYSEGAFGAFANGLAHPDVFSAMSMVSGGGFPFPGLLFDDTPVAAPVAIAPPVGVPYRPIPGVVPTAAPEQVFGAHTYGALATVGFGDVVADNWNWRQANPIDLAANGRAWSGDVQSSYLKFRSNDTLPHRGLEDLLERRTTANALEVAETSLSMYLKQILDLNHVAYRYDMGPGDHWDPYQRPFFREDLEALYAHLQHWDGNGTPLPYPDRFDYRTSAREFDIWGWHVSVDRAANEFLYLTDVTCDGLTARGTGTVVATPPASCGKRSVSIDLGPSQATDEPMGAGSFTGYGRTVRVQTEAP